MRRSNKSMRSFSRASLTSNSRWRYSSNKPSYRPFSKPVSRFKHSKITHRNWTQLHWHNKQLRVSVVLRVMSRSLWSMLNKIRIRTATKRPCFLTVALHPRLHKTTKMSPMQLRSNKPCNRDSSRMLYASPNARQAI